MSWTKVYRDDERNEEFYFDRHGRPVDPEELTKIRPVCPECNSDDVLEAEEFDSGNYSIYFSCICETCGYEWEYEV